MARPRSRTLDFLVYLAIRLAVCIAQMLPPRLLLSLAGPLGWLGWRVDRRHRLAALDNLRHAFPEKSEAEIERLVRQVYVHFVTVALEIAILPRILHHASFDRHIRHPDLERYREFSTAVRSGRPVLMLTAHMGNWEVLSYALGLDGYKGAAIARRLDNPFLDAFLKRFRTRTGQELLCKNEDWPRIQQVLESGGMLGLLGDQDAGPRGMFVEFFGRPASTNKAIGLLATRYDALVLVMATARVGDGPVYEVLLPDLIDPRDYAGHPDPERAITQRYTAALESMVRAHPEQYFWLHRRWKHQPKARVKPPAAA